MKRLLWVIILLAVCTVWLWARPKPNVYLNNQQEILSGANTSRSFTWTDTMANSEACTSAWMQVGYDFTSTSSDSNKMTMQVGANWFVGFVKLTSYLGDSATISSARVQISLTDGGDVYEMADSSRFWIGLSDLKPTQLVYRCYPIYVHAGDYIRGIVENTTVADSCIFEITFKGLKQ